MGQEYRERFPRHRFQRKPLVSDPDMHHGTCVKLVPWWMSGSLTRGGGENVPSILGACATRNFTYLVRSQLLQTWSRLFLIFIPNITLLNEELYLLPTTVTGIPTPSRSHKNVDILIIFHLWIPFIPVITCPPLFVSNNMILNSASVAVTTVVNVTCTDGYAMKHVHNVTNIRVTCHGDGTWKPFQPYCIRKLKKTFVMITSFHWNAIPRYWPFVRGIHRSPVDSLKRSGNAGFDLSFDINLNKRLNKPSSCWWFGRPWRSFWRDYNVVPSCYNSSAKSIITKEAKSIGCNMLMSSPWWARGSKSLPHYWSIEGEIHQWIWVSCTKGQWCGAWIFLFVVSRACSWVVDELRRRDTMWP